MAFIDSSLKQCLQAHAAAAALAWQFDALSRKGSGTILYSLRYGILSHLHPGGHVVLIAVDDGLPNARAVNERT